MDSNSLEYLEAMGIDVYQLRTQGSEDAAAEIHQLIALGEGDGDILCIVESRDQSQLGLAAGIAGAMRSSPVWAWPVSDETDSACGQSLSDTVAEKLTTRVLIFGEVLANQILGTGAPTVISAARVHVVPGLEQVGQDQKAKRALWKLMLDNGIAAPRGDKQT
ncbi:MAG TPA: hypothetical protein VJ984_11800 [Xanthomonadales bacterium]|nr:hypothetical protein [Xanthomonadales bacterium]